MRISCLIILLMLASSDVALSQDDPHAACVGIAPSFIPAEILERPLPIRTGIGNSQEKVTTSSAEAQAFYNQGINYLESYVWIEAARSFRQAIRHDRNLALAYLGLSYVASGLDKPGDARSNLEQAKSLSGSLSDRERRRIDIREKQLIAIQNLEDVQSHVAYKKAIDDALIANLNDPQLWLLRGNAEESTAAGRGQRGGVASIAFYQQALNWFLIMHRPIITLCIRMKQSTTSKRRCSMERSTLEMLPQFLMLHTCGDMICAE